jgi:5-methyltetrahydrofolate--homocysteine methyltransferase
MSGKLKQASEFLQSGDMEEVVRLCQECVTDGISSQDILNALLEGMSEIGVRFKNNEVFVPEVLIAARAMGGGLDVIRPLLEADGVESIGKVVIGTVKGDLHDIGKNIVSMMLSGAGFEVIDLGCDVSTEKFISAVEDHQAEIVCLSTLMTSTMPNMKMVIDALEEKGLRSQVKVMVGGAPISANFANDIGADRFAPDAASAAADAKELMMLASVVEVVA